MTESFLAEISARRFVGEPMALDETSGEPMMQEQRKKLEKE